MGDNQVLSLALLTQPLTTSIIWFADGSPRVSHAYRLSLENQWQLIFAGYLQLCRSDCLVYICGITEPKCQTLIIWLQISYVQAGVARVSGAAQVVFGGVAQLLISGKMENVIKSEIQKYVDTDLRVNTFGQIEVSVADVRLAPYVKFKVFQLSGFTIDIDKSKVEYLTVIIDLAGFANGRNKNPAELNAIKEENRYRAYEKQQKQAEKNADQKAEQGAEGEDADPLRTSSAFKPVNKEAMFARINLETLLVQAPGATVLMRNLNICVLADQLDNWNVENRREETIKDFKEQMISDFEEKGDNKGLKRFKDQLEEDDKKKKKEEEDKKAKLSDDALDEEDVTTETAEQFLAGPQKRKKTKTKTWAETGIDFGASVVSSTLLKDFNLQLIGLQVDMDTAAVPDLAFRFGIKFRAGEVHVEHAGLYGEVDLKYNELIQEGHGLAALRYHKEVGTARGCGAI